MPEEQTDLQKAEEQFQTAVKILGGFGARVHMDDFQYAAGVNALQNSICAVPADRVECMMVLIKYRKDIHETDPSKDTFDLCGGAMGTEPELTALLIALGADVQKFRAKIADKIKQEEEDGLKQQGTSGIHEPENDDVSGAD